MKQKLSKTEIKKLVEAHRQMKMAENNFKALKEKLCADLEDGVYESEYGDIQKLSYEKDTTDYKSFIADNPKLKNKLKEYITTTVKSSIRIK